MHSMIDKYGEEIIHPPPKFGSEHLQFYASSDLTINFSLVSLVLVCCLSPRNSTDLQFLKSRRHVLCCCMPMKLLDCSGG